MRPRRVLACLAALIGGCLAARAAPAPSLVILDNDFNGPGGTNIQSVIPLLASPSVKVLGFTVVTGDGWENASSAHLRRLLELIGHTDVPVHDGAVYPLLNSPARVRAHQILYGEMPWKGAWGRHGPITDAAMVQPPVGAMADGTPRFAADPEPAAMFLIRMVHAHPHQVTILAAGPLTNLALAARIDPEFASLAKDFVMVGGLVDSNLVSVNGNPSFSDDFNMVFDPEAAHIVLTQNWPKITVIAGVSGHVMLSRDDVAAIANAHPSPLTTYMARFYDPMPLWDEMAAAIVADPTLITKTQSLYMDVSTTEGMFYGHTRLWQKDYAPRDASVRAVDYVEGVDDARFARAFRDAVAALK